MEMKGTTAQIGSAVLFPDGTSAVVDANGYISVPAALVNSMLAAGMLPVPIPFLAYSTTDNGTTQTLTAAMVSGADKVHHLSTGGATPTLTTPTAAAIIAGIPNMAVGQSYVLRLLNANSGIATLAAGSGVTITGTATLAAGTWTEFLVTKTAAATVTLQNIGSGTVV